jgi:hypothetical protein
LNPWTGLPDRAPFVLAEDRAIVEAHNLRRKAEHQFQLEALPEPHLGPSDAPVVLLNLNPGFDPSDLVNYATAARNWIMRRSLTHELIPDEAFYFLTDEFQDTGGWHWWKAKLKPVIEAVGLERVRRGVQVIELVPYKSRRYYGLPEVIPGWIIGLMAGSVVLGWLYEQAGSSLLIVALFHTFLNMAIATSATEGLPAAITTATVIVWSIFILRREHRPGAPSGRDKSADSEAVVR